MDPQASFTPDPSSGVVIVIVTYNSAKTIDACLSSVLRTISDEDEIVVVDNGSRDETGVILQRYAAEFPNIRAVLTGQNLGFAEGCNVGTRASQKEFVCLLNPDTVVTPTWLDRMKVPFLTDKVAAVGPTSDAVAGMQKIELHLPTTLQGDYSYDEIAGVLGDMNGFTIAETKLLIGFCVLFRRDVYEQLGMLDPELFLGSDDLDISWRLQLAGFKLAIARDVFVHHENHVSFSSDPESKTRPLAEASANHFGRKLIAHYGEGNVPSQEELWGINWFECGVDVWPAPPLGVEVSVGTTPMGGTHYPSIEALGRDCEPESVDTLRVNGVLEFVDDVLGAMGSLLSKLKVGGRLSLQIPHHLAPDTWSDVPYRNLFGPKAFDIFIESPQSVGWTEFGLKSDGFQLFFTDLGSQIHFNRGLPIAEVVEMPRAVKSIEMSFRKVAIAAKDVPQPLIRTPLATMVLPAYRRRAMLMRQIDSICAQTEKAFEVFIVGDGCPEFAELLTDPYLQAKLAWARTKGTTIHAFNMAQNHGTPHVIINEALENARGEYFLWAADDDYIAPNHVDHYLSSVRGTAWEGALFNTNLIGDFYTNQRETRLELGHVGHSEVIVRTDAARQLPAHLASDFQDWEFVLALAQRGKLAKSSSTQATFHVNLTSRQRFFQVAA